MPSPAWDGQENGAKEDRDGLNEDRSFFPQMTQITQMGNDS
jgi:hypothetical protein